MDFSYSFSFVSHERKIYTSGVYRVASHTAYKTACSDSPAALNIYCLLYVSGIRLRLKSNSSHKAVCVGYYTSEGI